MPFTTQRLQPEHVPFSDEQGIYARYVELEAAGGAAEAAARGGWNDIFVVPAAAPEAVPAPVAETVQPAAEQQSLSAEEMARAARDAIEGMA